MILLKRDIQYSAQYRRDYKKAKKQGKNISLLREVIELLANDEPLPEKHCDHALQGNWNGYRECHITPNWLLVYRKTDNGELLLIMARLASHSELDF
ncbi:MAG: type II toxin-antitoxin system YafQ family toxin [Oscillospiraceae bacterium]|nr:type II toxin-antitoxin system YafQ family toxin [Oscillospiraceae bacterium]